MIAQDSWIDVAEIGIMAVIIIAFLWIQAWKNKS